MPDNPTEAELEENVLNGNVHLAVVLRKRMPVGQDEALDFGIIYLADSPTSKDALDYVQHRMATANSEYLRWRLGQPGPSIEGLKVTRRAMHRSEGGLGISLSALVPLILILMTITGAVYPAIDLTAGERERGTLEILVAAPVPRMGLLFAKYVSVVTVAVLTALANLVMMTVTISLSGLGSQIFGEGLSPLLILEIFGLLLLFAAFFSAVLLTISSFARSFKEAQAYLIPLMLVSLVPGVVGMIPGLKLNGIFSVLPLVNIVLLGRDLFEGNANPALAIVVVLSTVAYAAAAISIAARIFGSEGVLYNEQSGWGDLFRRPSEAQNQPTVATAMLCYALSIPAMYVLQGVLPPSAEAHMIGLALGTVLVFGLMPLLVAMRRNVRIASAFRCHSFSPLAFAGALLLAVALFLPIFELLAFLKEAGLTLMTSQEASIEELLNRWRQLSPVVVAASYVAVAIAEEWFFRGFLLSALRSVGSPTFAILACGALFGFLHFVFAFDRLISSMLLGILLSWIAYQSGSVVPGMIVHGGFNAIFILAAYYKVETADIGGTPMLWALSAAGLLVGSGLIYLGRRRNED